MVFLRSLCCLFCISTIMAEITEPSMDKSNSPSTNETFMYFAYGSNLLSKRIHIQNPTAKRRTIGKLKDYKLDFLLPSSTWNGCSATIVEDEASIVWGAIWEIDMSNMADLDRQEGVERNVYKVLTKNIETPTGEEITCRLYQQVNNPNESVKFEDIPIDRRPSRTYLNVILEGAEESELPIEYINDLKRIPHNLRDAPAAMLKQLGWE